MRFLMFLGLIFISPAIIAQQSSGNTQQPKKEIVGDTSFIAKQDSLFFDIRVTYYSNGETQTNTNPLGDSLSVVKYFSNRMIFISRQISEVVLNSILVKSEGFSLMSNDESKLKRSGFLSSFEVSLDSFENNYIGTWNMSTLTNQNTAFKITKEGDQLWFVGDQNKRHPLQIYSDKHFRILNFVDNKRSIDLFLVDNNRYVDVNVEYLIVKSPN